MEDTEQIETTDQSKPEQHEPGKSKQKRVKKRGPDLQLQSCLNTAEELLASPTLKEAKKCDLLISRMSTLHDLILAEREEEDDSAKVELDALRAQKTVDDETINQLRAEISRLQASQHPVEVRTVPDPDAAVIRAASLAKDDLIQNSAQAIRENVEEPTRLKIAAVLVKKRGRDAQPFVSDIVDFASIYAASQKRDDELEQVLTQAAVGARGFGIQVAKATLFARGAYVPEVGSGSSKPVYGDIFTELDGK